MKAVRPSPSEKREGMRLNRFLARAGMGSRRGVEALVTDGRVSVDGEVVTDLATYVRPGVSDVRVDGSRINLPKEKTSFAFYKPKQVVST
ncbi:MAG: S4 domain-containing protein, partial [Acidobacteriota bacterium]